MAPVWESGGGNLGVPPKFKTKVKNGLFMVCTSMSITWISKITFLSALYIATFLDTHKRTQCALTAGLPVSDTHTKNQFASGP